jgi:hypothetical protein
MPPQSAPDPDLRARRQAVVREHMESENRHEFDVTMATFGHPRYEIVPTGEVYDGEAEVAGYFQQTRAAFPDQRNELIAMHQAESAVFEFEGEGIVCERVYFDAATILRQLGIAHDPMSLRGRVATLLNHPVTIGTAIARELASRTRGGRPRASTATNGAP